MNVIPLQAISLLNELELICLHRSNAIVSMQLNSFNYCYRIIINLFNINHLFAHSEIVSRIDI